ncbi:MAG: hypothetical protein Satyrvirus12_6 [Satyrvirus sp.]|uniref:Uncharacterized protein n=1 Tax=Satyrvirus sp. TaxID=2487771 RepID=A0A3G5ADU4_9VIRU|nr:MAG: hypothetical protein Satyrvirus12_6 [Satyrvirus sp.]
MTKNIDAVNRNVIYIKTRVEYLLQNGRKEIHTKSELDKFPVGALISYINKHDIFRTAGFLTKVTDDYFIYIQPDLKTRIRVRFKNVKKMYLGTVYETINDLVSIVKTNKKETKFPVIIDNIVVYYANNRYDEIRYRNTEKFCLMLAWFSFFRS